jgi:hypothetical protein
MPRTLHPALLALAFAAATPLAQADELNQIQLLNQQQFRALSEDLGSALSYKPLIPSESMGITGFDIGVAVTATDLANKSQYAAAFSGDAPSTLPVPTVRIHKGLPFGIDIGASLAAVPSSNIRVAGGELRWAFIEGSALVPAVAVRLSATSLSGVDQLKLRTTGVDLSISKGFAMLTPYAGVGTVRVASTPNAGALTKVSLSQTKVYAGLNVNLGLVNIAVEGDKTGDAKSAGVKLGFRF